MHRAKRSRHLAVVPPSATVGDALPAPWPHPAPSPAPALQIGGALRAVADAALGGDQRVKEVAAACFAAALGGCGVAVIERVGAGWCRASENACGPGELIAELPTSVATSGDISVLPGIGTFVPVNPGIGVLADCQLVDADRAQVLRCLAIGFELALTAANQYRVTRDAMEEIDSLQQVARRILSASELDEVLFSISRETARLLGADIGGVFLRDGDELVMRSCVGNDTLDIDRLRMKRGQGLAGRVLETGRPCKVDDYLASDQVSRDYFWLVRDEQIRCAVGAPLLAREGVIGVLEVWRRRDVPFTDQDEKRVAALANLTAIAVQNARLYESQKASVQQLIQTNESLRQQHEVMRVSAQLQDDVIGALLDGGGVTAIARIVARHAGVEVAILGTDLGVMAAYPAQVSNGDWLERVETAVRQFPGYANNTSVTSRERDGWLSLRPIVAGGDRIGWVCMRSNSEPAEMQEAASRQGAVASALYCLEQRAASVARASALGALMWDLLEGTPPVRQSALERLTEFHIDLRGPHRVVHCTIEGLAETARGEGWNMDTVQRKQRDVRDAIERALSAAGLKLASSRGDLIVAIIPALDAAQVTRQLKSLNEEILARDKVRTFWGVSAPFDSPSQLSNANQEAKCAALAVGKLGTAQSPVVIHEHLGVLTLLLNGGGIAEGHDLRKYIDRMLGPMLKYDSAHHGVLAKTIRSYLDNDCSLKLTALQLFVHEKTVRYRLAQFEELTGVDLRRHRERMSVDLALLMHDFATRSAGVAGKGAG